LGAAPPATTQSVKGIIAEYEAQMQEFSKAYQSAKTPEERQKLFNDKYPDPDKFAPRLLKLASASPKTPDARDAGKWVVNSAREAGSIEPALDILMNFP